MQELIKGSITILEKDFSISCNTNSWEYFNIARAFVLELIALVRSTVEKYRYNDPPKMMNSERVAARKYRKYWVWLPALKRFLNLILGFKFVPRFSLKYTIDSLIIITKSKMLYKLRTATL